MRLFAKLAAITAATLLSVGAVFATAAPTNLQVDCVTPINTGYATTPLNCNTDSNSSPSLAFSWTCAGQTAYELEVDNDSVAGCGYTGNPTSPSSVVPCYDTSGGSSTTFSTTFQTGAGTWDQIPVKGVYKVWWRVRCNDGSGMSPWTSTYFAYNNPPTESTNLSVAGGGTGAGASVTYDPNTMTDWYVDDTGTDGGGCGAIGSPCRTVDYVLTTRLGSGYTNGANIYLRDGIYATAADRLCVSGGSYPTPTRSNPIIIKAYPGESVHNNVAGGMSCGGSQTSVYKLAKSYYVVDGIIFNNTGSGLSMEVQGSHNIVRNNQFVGSNDSCGGSSTCPNGQISYALTFGAGTDNWWLGNNFSRSGSCLPGSSGKDLLENQVIGSIVRGNRFSGIVSRAYNMDGSQSTAGHNLFMENLIESIACSNPTNISNYEGGSQSLYRNVIKGGDRSGPFLLRKRLGKAQNNTTNFSTCMRLENYFGTGSLINSNVCRGGHGILDIANKTEWMNANLATSQYNNSDSSVACTRVWDAQLGACNESYIIAAGGDNQTDPALDGNLQPTTSSSAIVNLGDPALPVPDSGNTRIDKGRFEYGATIVGGIPGYPATGHYDYQPKWHGVGLTPVITWTFTDPDNVALSAGNTQAAYEVEIDTTNTFDSGGPFRPLCSSGVVSSSTAAWNVPAACGLVANTRYYFRLRTYDNLAPTTPGEWTDVAYAFSTDQPPARITDLTVVNSTLAKQLHAKLSWTATGATGSTGTAASYQIRASTSTMSNCTDGVAVTTGTNASGTVVTSIPAPLATGNTETFTAFGFRPGVNVYFGVCATSASGQSQLSNVVLYTPPTYEGDGFQANGGGFNGTAFPTFRVVTSTADTNTAGTLRNAIASLTNVAPGDYIILNVSGTSTMATQISALGKSYWTIDGSAAPTLGFTLKTSAGLVGGLRVGNGSHIIIDGMRFEGVNSTDDALSVDNTSGVTQHFVVSHCTFYNIARVALGLFDVAKDVSIVYNFFKDCLTPITNGGTDTGAHARITFYRNVFGNSGEQQPQLLPLTTSDVTDINILNQIHYGWSATGTYAIRIRNDVGTCDITPGTFSVNANIENNAFIDSGANKTKGLIYACSAGCESESGPCAQCSGITQAATGAAVVCNGTDLGQLYVANNYFPAASTPTDSFSTVTSERTRQTGAINEGLVLPSGLAAAVIPTVGTYIRVAAETTLLNTISAAMPVCGDNVAQQGEVCDGTDLRSETCFTLGYTNSIGTPACAATCDAYELDTGAGSCVRRRHGGKGTAEPM